ncbi:MAG: hypothetical protein H0Z24_05665 [Thermosipho sp. (in: Bacteria)]|nr:hypothetical protein [Thermosipho sp. (in: thermotogales)]
MKHKISNIIGNILKFIFLILSIMYLQEGEYLPAIYFLIFYGIEEITDLFKKGD